jgi:hypothetical protein
MNLKHLLYDTNEIHQSNELFLGNTSEFHENYDLPWTSVNQN